MRIAKGGRSSRLAIRVASITPRAHRLDLAVNVTRVPRRQYSSIHSQLQAEVLVKAAQLLGKINCAPTTFNARGRGVRKMIRVDKLEKDSSGENTREKRDRAILFRRVILP